MKKKILLFFCLILILALCACTYNTTLKESAFHDSCNSKKIPMKIGIVETQQLRSWVVFYKTGNYKLNVRVNETLRNSVYDLIKCHFQDVRFVKDTRESENLDAYAYCKYVVEGQKQSLDIDIKENKDNREIVSFRHNGPINYSHPTITRPLGIITGVSLGLLAPITVPIMTQSMGAGRPMRNLCSHI